MEAQSVPEDLRFILVVEKQPEVARLLRRSLRGAKILAANNGTRALRIIARTRFDLVIMDAELPDCSGIDVLRSMRSLDTSTPVIIVTAHGSAVSARAAMKFGAFDYLTKPFRGEELRCAVADALASSSAPPIALHA
jgi:DNA-binding NtrC family response regulator